MFYVVLLFCFVFHIFAKWVVAKQNVIFLTHFKC